MAKPLVECPQCKGAKTITCQSSLFENGVEKKYPPTVMRCITCKGEGVVTAREAKEHADYQAMWCRCEEEHDPIFVPDSPKTGKHHWLCSHCKKVTQIG